MHKLIYVSVDHNTKISYMGEHTINPESYDPNYHIIDEKSKLSDFIDDNDSVNKKLEWGDIPIPTEPGVYKLYTKIYMNHKNNQITPGTIDHRTSFKFRILQMEKCFDINTDIKNSTTGLKKIFISFPSENMTSCELKQRFSEAIKYLDKFMMHEAYTLLDPSMIPQPENKSQLQHMSDVLNLMSKADYVYFTLGWDKSRQCRLENQCAQEYAVQTIYEMSEHKHIKTETNKSLSELKEES